MLQCDSEDTRFTVICMNDKHIKNILFLEIFHTVQTLHLRLFCTAALLETFGFASLFTVKHETQHSDDVRYSHGHRQSDGLKHLKLTLVLVLVFVARVNGFL